MSVTSVAYLPSCGLRRIIVNYTGYQTASDGIPYCTIQYDAIPYHTILCHTATYYTVPYHTKPYLIAYHTVPYNTIPYHHYIVPYHIKLCHTKLNRTVPYHAVPYRTIPHYAVPYAIPYLRYHAKPYYIDVGSVCEVGIVGKISDCQPWGPGFIPRPGRGLNFWQPSFATPSVDRDVKPLV